MSVALDRATRYYLYLLVRYWYLHSVLEHRHLIVKVRAPVLVQAQPYGMAYSAIHSVFGDLFFMRCSFRWLCAFLSKKELWTVQVGMFRKAWQFLTRRDEYEYGPIAIELRDLSSAGCLRSWELSCRRVGKTLGIWSFFSSSFPFPFLFGGGRGWWVGDDDDDDDDERDGVSYSYCSVCHWGGLGSSTFMMR